MKLKTLAIFSALALSAGAAHAADISASGFFIGGVTGSDGHQDFSEQTKLAVQIDAKISEKVFATFQAVNRENLSDFTVGRETAIEYGFVGYKASEQVTVRAGRLRVPFFMLSEYVEVGNVVPWVQAPNAVYSKLPTNAYDGFDVVYNGSFGDVNYSANAFVGNGEARTMIGDLSTEIRLEHAKGANVLLNYQDWNFRLSYGQADVSFHVDDLTQMGMEQNFNALSTASMDLNNLASMTNDAALADAYRQQAAELASQAGQLGFLIEELPAARKIAIINAGLSGYLTDNLSLMAEYSALESDNNIINDNSGYYVAASYEYNDYMFTATYATEEDKRLNNTIEVKEDELIFTVAKDLGDNWLAKAEIAKHEITTNNVVTEDFTRWGLTINYVF